MKNRIKNILKGNRVVYICYYCVFTMLLNILKLFIKVKDNIILINSYGGLKFDDSPRVIFEYMKTQRKYDKYDIYWAFQSPEKFNVEGAKKIKADTLKYFIIALKAKYWITNSAIERGLKFKNKKTIYINTWHGTPLKKMGIDAPQNAYKFKASKCDIFYAQSQYDIDVFSKAFQYDKSVFALVGLPRNDELFNVNNEEVMKIKEKLNIDCSKRIILYAPTFREYLKEENGCIIEPPINTKKWKEKLEKEYVILVRAHYEVMNILGIKNNDFFIDVSKYKKLNDLLKISDVLISDYSSIMIDYSILERPIFSFAYDYEEYKSKRGLYFDLNQKLPNGICQDEDELLNKILKCDFEKEKIKTNIFSKKFVQNEGQAQKYIDEIIK